MSALENETNGETTTFEHFGRTWTVPTQRHLRHLKALTDETRRMGGLTQVFIVQTFLSEEEFADLLELDPGETRFEEFADKVAATVGVGSSGNSKPSSAPS